MNVIEARDCLEQRILGYHRCHCYPSYDNRFPTHSVHRSRSSLLVVRFDTSDSLATASPLTTLSSPRHRWCHCRLCPMMLAYQYPFFTAG